jgi:ribosomal protein L17
MVGTHLAARPYSRRLRVAELYVAGCVSQLLFPVRRRFSQSAGGRTRIPWMRSWEFIIGDMFGIPMSR